jgi:hypothetical protein
MTTAAIQPGQTMDVSITGNPSTYSDTESVGRWSSSILAIAGLLGIHSVLALAMHQFPTVATIHGWAVGVIAIVLALRAQPAKVAAAGAYVAGADVLWRMTGAGVFWEYAKYLLVLMFILTILRRRGEFRWRLAPIGYFALLIPSISVLLTDPRLDTKAITGSISFGLSGPLALAVAIWFLSQVKFSNAERRNLFLSCIAPLVGIATLTLVSTYSVTEIAWTNQSNFMTSGDFGPNQVSTALGLGGLLAFLVGVDSYTPRSVRWIMTGISLVFITQAVMTFSRGGVYSAAAGAILVSVTLVLSPRGRRDGGSRGALLLVGLFVLFMGSILPRLDEFTGGRIATRLQETTLTHRDELIRDDLRLWSEHPLLGVGPGATIRYRINLVVSNHTEFTRLLAEHGLLGVFALLTLIGMCFARVLQARDGRELALVIGLMSWGLVTMVHASMRTLAPSFMLGLAFAFLMPADRGLAVTKFSRPIG